jgi:hypothetical protein
MNFDIYMDKIIIIFVNFMEKPVAGKLTEENDEFIKLERIDGRITTISKRAILSINPAKEVI